MLKVNNRNDRTMGEICSNLLVKTAIVAKVSIDVFLVPFFLTLSRIYTFFWWIHCWLWASKCQLRWCQSFPENFDKFLKAFHFRKVLWEENFKKTLPIVSCNIKYKQWADINLTSIRGLPLKQTFILLIETLRPYF